MAAASTIKLPILVAFFQAVDQGRIKLNDLLTMKESHVAEGSGNMQFRNPGSKYTSAISLLLLRLLVLNVPCPPIPDIHEFEFPWGVFNGSVAQGEQRPKGSSEPR